MLLTQLLVAISSFFWALEPQVATSYLNLHFLSPLYPNTWENTFGLKYPIKIMLSVFQTNVIAYKFNIQ